MHASTLKYFDVPVTPLEGHLTWVLGKFQLRLISPIKTAFFAGYKYRGSQIIYVSGKYWRTGTPTSTDIPDICISVNVGVPVFSVPRYTLYQCSHCISEPLSERFTGTAHPYRYREKPAKTGVFPWDNSKVITRVITTLFLTTTMVIILD